jgi:hypothetical protein
MQYDQDEVVITTDPYIRNENVESLCGVRTLMRPLSAIDKVR